MAYVVGPSECLFVMKVQNSAGDGPTSIRLGLLLSSVLTQASVDRISNTARDAVKGAADAGWSFGNTYFLENDASLFRTWTDPTVEAGTGAAEVYCPPQVAVVVKKATGLAGARNRGRIYWPVVAEAGVAENGDIEGAYRTGVQVYMTALFTNLVADADITSLLLLHTEGTPGPSVPLTALQVTAVCGTQRRRLRR